jgi:hypothetical protein
MLNLLILISNSVCRDLAARNILLEMKDQRLQSVVSDFGFARILVNNSDEAVTNGKKNIFQSAKQT